MSKLISYSTPQLYLEATKAILEERELQNNLILGICNAFEDKTKVYGHCVFINAVEEGEIKACSIKTMTKAIVSGTVKDKKYFRLLADYYINHPIELQGAIGETFYVTAFSDYYTNQIREIHHMIAHRLDLVNPLPTPVNQKLIMATMDDLDLLSDWLLRFEIDALIYPRQSIEQIRTSTTKRISQGHFFKWIDGDDIVSMAAIVRKTKNIGIIGCVYTPDGLRGRGYATACVQKLSEYILSIGYRSCGLFTDKNNPTSNHIYKSVGYVQIAEFADIIYD